MTFWDHLDELRGVLLRSALLATVFAVAAFCLKDALFAFLLAPTHGDFVTYRLLEGNVFSERLINIWIEKKMSEANAIKAYPHPAEFKYYYDL